MAAATVELHPLFEPDVLEQVAWLRRQYEQERAGIFEEACAPAQEPPPAVQVLDRLVRMFQDQRDALGVLTLTVQRVIDVLGEPMPGADGTVATGTGTDQRGESRELYRETCTVQEACALVGVVRRTMYNWMAKGKVRVVRTAGGGPRIYRASLFYEGARK